ncbi:MAG: nitroreductase [Clostridiales bacterium]|nr:nitroreductase [Clostridiales bacterium]
MTVDELVRNRHSVRKYLDKPIPEDIRDQLNETAESINGKSGLHIQIIYDEPECFNCRKAHYGKFENVKNYISIIGPKDLKDLEEKSGYYGEMLVLKAQDLGLNTCWVALTHGKSKAEVADGEKEVIIISLGYGADQGRPHKNKKPEDVSNITEGSPGWFCKGVEYALLAPTAINQQRFYLYQQGFKVSTKIPPIGGLTRLDLGIVKYHFELGAGNIEFKWAEGKNYREKFRLGIRKTS